MTFLDETPTVGSRTQTAKIFPAARRSAAVGLSVLGFGCALFSSPEPVPVLDARSRALRIEALREAIRDDHASLERLVTLPAEDRSVDLHRDPEVEKIAQRLGAHESELARLIALEREAER